MPKFIKHKFSDDAIEPRVGQLVRIRFSDRVVGPASRVSLSLASQSQALEPTSGCWRFALIVVCAKVLGQGFLITALPVPAFSKEADPVAWMDTQSENFRNSHIPVPTAALQPDLRPTPAAFGAPLAMNGYQDGRPSWIQGWAQSQSLDNSDEWRSFDPDVQCPDDEVMRLIKFVQVVAPLRAAYLSEGGLAVNMAVLPTDNYLIRTLFASLGQDYVPPISQDYEDEDDDPNAENDRYDSIAGLVDHLPNPHPVAVQAAKEETERKQRDLVNGWLSGLWA